MKSHMTSMSSFQTLPSYRRVIIFIFKVWRQRRPIILYWCRPNLLLVNYLILVTMERLTNECHCALVLNPQRLLTVPSSNYLIIPDPNNPSWQWFIKWGTPTPNGALPQFKPCGASPLCPTESENLHSINHCHARYLIYLKLI